MDSEGLEDLHLLLERIEFRGSHEHCTEEDHAHFTPAERCLLRQLLSKLQPQQQQQEQQRSLAPSKGTVAKSPREPVGSLDDLLTSALTSEDEQALHKTAKVLSQYSCVKHTRSQLVVHKDCRRALVHLLSSTHQPTRFAALIALKNLAAEQGFSDALDRKQLLEIGKLVREESAKDVFSILSSVRQPDIVDVFMISLMRDVLSCLSLTFCKPWDALAGTESEVDDKGSSTNSRRRTTVGALQFFGSVLKLANAQQRKEMARMMTTSEHRRSLDKICKLAGCSSLDVLQRGSTVLNQLCAFENVRELVLARKGARWPLEALMYVDIEESPQLLRCVAQLSASFGAKVRVEGASPSQVIAKCVELLHSQKIDLKHDATIVLGNLSVNELYRDLILQKDEDDLFLGLLLEVADEGETEIPETLHEAFRDAYGPDSLAFLSKREEPVRLSSTQSVVSSMSDEAAERESEEAREETPVPSPAKKGKKESSAAKKGHRETKRECADARDGREVGSDGEEGGAECGDDKPMSPGRNWSAKLWTGREDCVGEVEGDSSPGPSSPANSPEKQPAKGRKKGEAEEGESKKKERRSEEERESHSKREEKDKGRASRSKTRDEEEEKKKGKERGREKEKDKEKEGGRRARASRSVGNVRSNERDHVTRSSSNSSRGKGKRRDSADDVVTRRRRREKGKGTYRAANGKRRSMKGISGGGWPTPPPKEEKNSSLSTILSPRGIKLPKIKLGSKAATSQD